MPFGAINDMMKKAGAAVSSALSNPMDMHNAAMGKLSPSEYDAAAKSIADVFMFSGCGDEQTSADVSNTAGFSLPQNAGPGGAGGACTNAFLHVVYKDGKEEVMTYVQILSKMRDFLKQKGYTQITQLSASRQLQLSKAFDFGKSSGNHKALLCGINYVDATRGRLSGCINDVVALRKYIGSKGFKEDPSNMRVCIDDHADAKYKQHMKLTPHKATKAEILAGINWLVKGAKAGDILFFSFSGHGGQTKDLNGDEEDGMDETICPEDYSTKGIITDDLLFEKLVAPLPPGVRLVCIMDCCHSGTVLDLPYTFCATDANVEQAEAGAFDSLFANPGFGAEIVQFIKSGVLGHLPNCAALTKFAKGNGWIK